MKEKKKERESKTNACKKKGYGATRIAPGAAARREKKRKRKKKENRVKAREASEQEATEGAVARVERQQGAGKAVEADTADKRERNKDKDRVVVC